MMEEPGRIERILKLMTALFFLLGLVFFIPGLFFSVHSEALFDELRKTSILDKIFRLKMKEDLTGDNPELHGLKFGNEPVLLIFHTQGFLTAIGTVCIMIGSLISVLSLAGFKLILSMESMQVFVYLDFVLLFVAILAKIFYSKEDYIARKMKNSLVKYQGAVDSSQWNQLMYDMQCCGSYSYKDFRLTEHWPRDIPGYNVTDLEISLESPDHYAKFKLPKDCYFRDNSTNTSKVVYCKWMESQSYLTPIACCKDIADVFTGCNLKGIANDTNNNMNTGCAKKVLHGLATFFGNETSEVLFGLLLFCLIVYCLLLCVLLVKYSTKSDEDEFVANYDFTRSPSCFTDENLKLFNEEISDYYQEWITKEELAKRREGKDYVNKKTQTTGRGRSSLRTLTGNALNKLMNTIPQSLYPDRDTEL